MGKDDADIFLLSTCISITTFIIIMKRDNRPDRINDGSDLLQITKRQGTVASSR